MPNPDIRGLHIELQRKRPNSTLIFVLACIVVFLFPVGAWLVLHGPRYHFVPASQKHSGRHAYLRMADPGTRSV